MADVTRAETAETPQLTELIEEATREAEEATTLEVTVVESATSALGPLMRAGGYNAGVAPSVENVIASWLSSAYERSKSVRTRDTYATLLADFRATLVAAGLDLDSDPRLVAAALNTWAGRARRRDGREVSDATRGLRIAAISSFYQHAIELRMLQPLLDPEDGRARLLPARENPARLRTIVARPKPTEPPVYALAATQVQEAIRAIDSTTLTGKRDLALLALAFTTGRRASELRGLTWGDVLDVGGWQQGAMTVRWRRTKGHKAGADNTLAPEAIAPLRAWRDELRRLADEAGMLLADDVTLWPRLDPGARGALDLSQPLGYTGLQRIYERRLGITRTHRARHSFAEEMERQGARVSEIMTALGHADLKVTTAYLRRLEEGREKDKHASAVARSFGF